MIIHVYQYDRIQPASACTRLGRSTILAAAPQQSGGGDNAYCTLGLLLFRGVYT